MAVTTDIVRTWRSPRVVMRELLSHGQREDRAIAYVMAACLILYVAQWPRLKRAEQFELYGPDGASDFQMNAGIAFFAMLIVWPLMLYIIAAITHLVAKIFRAKGTHYTARLALFWAFLAASPVGLLYGLTIGLIGPGPATNLVGWVWAIVFGWIWTQCFRVAEGETHAL